jgi:hypothetical protein
LLVVEHRLGWRIFDAVVVPCRCLVEAAGGAHHHAYE